MNSILLLEDDPNLAKSLIRYLRYHEYAVDWAKNGEEAVELSYDHRYDLYLFDINVPLLNGTDLLRSLRDADDRTPTIIISALTDIDSITEGFLSGADDYIKKPFDPEELLIRIKAKTRTLQQHKRINDLEVDLENETIWQNNEQIRLGEVQTKLLLSLVKHHPNPVAKEDLLDLLEKPSDLALRVNISKLKKQLGVTIKSIRGVGYQII